LPSPDLADFAWSSAAQERLDELVPGSVHYAAAADELIGGARLTRPGLLWIRVFGCGPSIVPAGCEAYSAVLSWLFWFTWRRRKSAAHPERKPFIISQVILCIAGALGPELD
jgi:hypothetical protein